MEDKTIGISEKFDAFIVAEMPRAEYDAKYTQKAKESIKRMEKDYPGFFKLVINS